MEKLNNILDTIRTIEKMNNELATAEDNPIFTSMDNDIVLDALQRVVLPTLETEKRRLEKAADKRSAKVAANDILRKTALDFLEQNENATPSQLANVLEVSVQKVTATLRPLISENKVIVERDSNGRNPIYKISSQE